MPNQPSKIAMDAADRLLDCIDWPTKFLDSDEASLIIQAAMDEAVHEYIGKEAIPEELKEIARVSRLERSEKELLTENKQLLDLLAEWCGEEMRCNDERGYTSELVQRTHTALTKDTP